jgi:hypothetical protein
MALEIGIKIRRIINYMYYYLSGLQNENRETGENPTSRTSNNHIEIISREFLDFLSSGKVDQLEEENYRMKVDNNNLNQKIETLTANHEEEKRMWEREKQEFATKSIKRDKELVLERQNMQNMKKDMEELKKHKSQLELAKQNMEKDMEINIHNLEQELKTQRRISEQKFQQAQEKYKEKVEDIRQKLYERVNGLHELEKENAKLKEEASRYQSALGVATNVRLSDDDQNNSVKLKNDILKLQNALENYVTHLKPNMDLDIQEIQLLAQKYRCSNKITVENPNKPFIKTLLQRRVLDLLFENSHILSKYRGQNVALELDIESKTKELLKLIEEFSKTRVGTDEVINAAAIKIRQQVYGILGNRGFNDMIGLDGNIYAHNLISYASKNLNRMMNRYRNIKDVDRKEQVEAIAPKLIQDYYKLFWFRVNVQEPITETLLFGNDKIDPEMMKGLWDEKEIDQLYVDICYFPLVGRNLNSSNKKIYTPAKVFPRDINETSKEY